MITEKETKEGTNLHQINREVKFDLLNSLAQTHLS